MDFDEYDYLEKTVEEQEDLDSSKKKKDSSEKSERSYRKREVDENLDGEDRKSKRSRGDEENGSRKDRDDRERERRSRSRSDRDRERERDLEIRDNRRFRDKKETVEPEADPERDQRTVFAYQMPLKATERDVYEFFSKAGKVRDVRLIMDRNSRRSKGVGIAIMMRDDGNTMHSCLINSCCVLKVDDIILVFFLVVFPVFFLYVCDTSKETQLELSALEFLFLYISLLYALYIEFYDAMSVPMAIALSGQLLLGQPVMVKPSEAEKNLVQSNASTGAAGVAGPYGAVDRKLYVGNLHFNMTESQLREIFEPFGPVELVQLPLDMETGHCKGFGFIQFAHLEHAKAAQSLNGKLDIAGRTIKVSSVTDHAGSQDTSAKSADFDDDEGGLSLNAQSRALLMQKLDRSGIATSIAGSVGVPVVNGSAPAQQAASLPSVPGIMPASALPTQIMPTPVVEPVGTPSECLLLKNMFDPTTETEPDFDIDIKEDVEEECSKFGRVKHIYVDKRSAGFVYLRFETVEAASGAQRAMHMRWFARRLISATFMQPQIYEAKFRADA
ncbi:RNA-binding protein 39-like isoform X1 [Senna tora]|uniref:RNA-binding protein 39-like isoform X1 n=1 Tax=Senna tora TaxID=362788 RepID=A0A835C9L9_9FABA|nr:RNA-binding protein 39-like isoform X1 [Senna tora]